MAYSPRQRLGHRYERVAETWLRRRGLVTLARNHRCRYGEIDLVMLDGNCLVVVEVRFRGPGARGRAAASVDRRKQRRLARAAEHFLRVHRAHRRRPVRFDVVAVDDTGSGDDAIEWLPRAFTLDP